MKREELERKIDETAEAIENYLAFRQPLEREDPSNIVLRRAVQRLSHGVYVLLPPRGPASALDCPHCGKSINVTLSK